MSFQRLPTDPYNMIFCTFNDSKGLWHLQWLMLNKQHNHYEHWVCWEDNHYPRSYLQTVICPHKQEATHPPLLKSVIQSTWNHRHRIAVRPSQSQLDESKAPHRTRVAEMWWMEDIFFSSKEQWWYWSMQKCRQCVLRLLVATRELQALLLLNNQSKAFLLSLSCCCRNGKSVQHS